MRKMKELLRMRRIQGDDEGRGSVGEREGSGDPAEVVELLYVYGAEYG